MVSKSTHQPVTSWGDVITWDEILINHGANFNESSNSYITPYTGTYLLVFHGRVNNNQAKFELYVDGEVHSSTMINTEGDMPSTEMTLTIHLTEGSSVWVGYAVNAAGNVFGRGTVRNDRRTWFTGYLVF